MAKAILPAGWRKEDGFCAWFNSTLSITVWRERYGRYWGILENGKEVGPFKNLTEAIEAVEDQHKPGILTVSEPLRAADKRGGELMDDIHTTIGDTEVILRVTYFHAGYPATSGPDAEEASPPYVEFKVLKDGDECQISEGEKERLYDFVLDYCLNFQGE